MLEPCRMLITRHALNTLHGHPVYLRSALVGRSRPEGLKRHSLVPSNSPLAHGHVLISVTKDP